MNIDYTFKKPFGFVLFVDFASDADFTITPVLQGNLDPS